MTTPRRATTQALLAPQVLGLLTSLTRYVSEESLELRRLRNEIDKLARVDAAGSWALRAIYLTAMGRASEAREAVQNALRLGVGLHNQGSLATNVHLNFANFGAALELLTNAADPRGGYFSSQIAWLVRAGGIRTAAKYCEIAKAMGMDTPKLPIDLARAVEALDTLDARPMSDADIALMLTTAGAVFCEHGLMTSRSESPELMQFEGGAFCFQFPLDVSPAEAASIAMEASERLAGLPFSSSAATVSFAVYRRQACSEPVVA